MALVLFVGTHADDESLSMGAGIRKHIEVGHEVHVLLLTAGLGSGAQVKTGLSDADFTAARDDEFRRACRALGVRAERIHITPTRSLDASPLTVEQAKAGISWFLAGHPGAWVKSYSNRLLPGANPPRHVDHIASGQAAVEMLADGLFPNLRLYVEPWVVSAFQGAYPSLALTTESAASPSRVRVALAEYQDVDHVGFKYGIGDLSVPTYLDQVYANPVSRYHLP